MEEILKQILTEVQALQKGQLKLQGDLQELQTGQLGLQTDLQELQTGQLALQTEVSGLAEQTKENSQFIQALLHLTEELDAKLDGLALNTATKESIADLDAKFEVLNQRLFRQETDIQRLKQAQ